MRVSVGQVYVKPGVRFPFSHSMQRWLGAELSSAAGEGAGFAKRFGAGFGELMVRVSADVQIADNVIKGPTVFKKEKDVEYTVFLPFDVIMAAPDGCRAAARFLFAGARAVFQQAGIDPAALEAREAAIVDHLCSEPSMLSEPWPQR